MAYFFSIWSDQSMFSKMFNVGYKNHKTSLQVSVFAMFILIFIGARLTWGESEGPFITVMKQELPFAWSYNSRWIVGLMMQPINIFSHQKLPNYILLQGIQHIISQGYDA